MREGLGCRGDERGGPAAVQDRGVGVSALLPVAEGCSLLPAAFPSSPSPPTCSHLPFWAAGSEGLWLGVSAAPRGSEAALGRRAGVSA